jgi:hypothetical protein
MNLETTTHPLKSHPSSVSWATAEFIREPSHWVSFGAFYMFLSIFILGGAYSYFATFPSYLIAHGELIARHEGGKPLMQIHLKREEIYQISKTMPVYLSFENYPEHEFGRVLGEVKSIEPKSGLVFIKLKLSFIDKKEKRFPLLSGMKVKAFIETGKEKMSDYIFKRVFSGRKEDG